MYKRQEVRVGVDTLIARRDGEGAAVDAYETACGIFVVAGLDAVSSRSDVERSVEYLHAVLAAQGVARGRNLVRSPGDYEVILGVDGMLELAIDFQRARSVEGQVSLAVNGGVGFVFAFGQLVSRPIGKTVDRALV